MPKEYMLELQLQAAELRSAETQQAVDKLVQATDKGLYDRTAIAPFFGFTKFQLKTGMEWLEKISDVDLWGFSNEQRLILLGDISENEYDALMSYDADNELTVSQKNVLERLCILWGISVSLRALVGKNCDIECFSRPNSNPIFCSKSIKEYLLINKDIEGFHRVKKYLINAIYY